MAVIARYLIDTSAAARMRHPEVAKRLAPLIDAGLVATTASLDAKALYSARTWTAYEQVRQDRRIAYEYLPTNDEHWQGALDAQMALARAGQHRSVAIPDLLTATLAATQNVTIIHYDADFEIAATVIAFQHEWVVPRGSL